MSTIPVEDLAKGDQNISRYCIDRASIDRVIIHTLSYIFDSGKAKPHYDDVIMDAIASQITSLASVYSDV